MIKPEISGRGWVKLETPAADAAGLVDVVHAVELVRRDAVVRRLEDVVNTPCFLTKYSIIILKLGYFIHSRVYRIL